MLIAAVITVACVYWYELYQSKKGTAATTSPEKSILSIIETKPSASTEDTLKSIVESGVVRVSAQSPSKPFFYVDHGVAQGFNVEFMKMLFGQQEFASKKGQIVLDTDKTVDTYEEVPAALLRSDPKGKSTVDIAIDGLTFSDESLPGVVYTIPYVDDFGYALITASGTLIKSVDDVGSMTIGILKGDPDVKAYASKQFPKAKLVELSDASTNGERDWIVRSIKGGKIDAMIYDYPFGVAEIKDTDLRFAFTKLPNSNIKYKIGVRKSDVALLDALNTAIRKVKSNPEYAELIRKYFTSANTAKVQAAAKTEQVYVVKHGDTLSKIAKATLGDEMQYSLIEARNNLANPNLIQVGQRLVIPKA